MGMWVRWAVEVVTWSKYCRSKLRRSLLRRIERFLTLKPPPPPAAARGPLTKAGVWLIAADDGVRCIEREAGTQPRRRDADAAHRCCSRRMLSCCSLCTSSSASAAAMQLCAWCQAAAAAKLPAMRTSSLAPILSHVSSLAPQLSFQTSHLSAPAISLCTSLSLFTSNCCAPALSLRSRSLARASSLSFTGLCPHRRSLCSALLELVLITATLCLSVLFL